MGSAIAGHLLKGGHDLVVWNRTISRTDELAAQGAKVAASPAQAATGCEVLFTMLMDDAAHEEVLLHPEGAVDALPTGAVHVSLSTISVELSRRLAREHASRNQHYIGAPVFGRPNVAAEGKLWITAAGPQSTLDRVLPLLQSFSRGLSVVGSEPQQAHALKLGGNFLITAMIASLSEGLVYAESQGIDPALYLEAVNNALFQSPFYQAYGKVMLNPPSIPGATITLGAKDTRLFREAAVASHAATPLADSFQQQMERASKAGLADQDWAAGYYKSVKSESGLG